MDTECIDDWWAKLNDREKAAVMRHRMTAPMTPWLVRSMQKAHIPGLVEEPPAPDIVPPCFLMPADVAAFVDRCRDD